MKLAKLSLAAIVALGVSAFADVQNIKVSGDAKLFYGTNDADQWAGTLNNNHTPNDASLFGKDNSYGQVAADLAFTADLADGVAAKVKATTLATLGLENNLVSDTWAGSNIGVDARGWISEAWLAKTFGKTTLKIGRQELDTPLAFSEKWNIAANSFDAAVVLNNDLPQTTLVAAWVGRGNGTTGAVVTGEDYNKYGTAIVNAYSSALTSSDVDGGAYAVAAVTKLIPMTTAQVWFYNVTDIANAWWLQADIDLKEFAPGLTFGAQYAMIDPQGKISSLEESKAWAVKLGYATGALKLAAAYSATDEDGVVVIANTATGATKGSQSKLYTEAWWNYGYVGRPDTKSWMISADYNMEGIADFMAQYTSSDQDTTGGDVDMTEFTLTATKSFGTLDATLAYIYTDADDQNVVSGKSDSYNTVQVYLTYNF